MNQWILLSLLSALAVTCEVLLMKKVKLDDPMIDMNALVWLFRASSMGFISVYLFFKIYQKDSNIVYTFNDNKAVWYTIVIGFFSSISIHSFYSALAEAPSAGLPSAVREIYIVLLFAGAFIFLKEKPKDIKIPAYIGVSLIVIGAIMVGVFSKTNGSEDI